MTPRIEVYCREEASVFRAAAPWAGISITTDVGDWPEIDGTNCVGLLRLQFADLEKPHPGEKLFDESDAQAILDFVGEVWPQIHLLMVHCRAGLRRSPAVAAAISRIYLGHDEAWFRQGVYDPNMLVYETLLNVARQRGLYLQPRNPRRKRRRG
ncbi:MAG: hypothetical protein HUU20_07725 [Pirellulales bacterium]|nr:hypothetical protein [Pirellulales bacterium]